MPCRKYSWPGFGKSPSEGILGNQIISVGRECTSVKYLNMVGQVHKFPEGMYLKGMLF